MKTASWLQGACTDCGMTYTGRICPSCKRQDSLFFESVRCVATLLLDAGYKVGSIYFGFAGNNKYDSNCALVIRFAISYPTGSFKWLSKKFKRCRFETNMTFYSSLAYITDIPYPTFNEAIRPEQARIASRAAKAAEKELRKWLKVIETRGDKAVYMLAGYFD